MPDKYVREVGRVTDMDSADLVIGVDYDTVTIGPYRLDADMAEEVARDFVSAVWQAGQQKTRMDAEASEDRAETDCRCPGDDCPCEADGPDGLCACCRPPKGEHRGTCHG